MRYLQDIPQNKAELLKLSGLRKLNAALLFDISVLPDSIRSNLSMSCCCGVE